MASLVPKMANYMYIIIRLKMAYNANNLSWSLMCHYWENDDLFPIGGLIEPDETLMGSAIKHYRHMVSCRIKTNDRLYLAKVLISFMNHEPVKIPINDIDVLFRDLKMEGSTPYAIYGNPNYKLSQPD
jgi:hypothetical protein